jgi:hypothetical protein
MKETGKGVAKPEEAKLPSTIVYDAEDYGAGFEDFTRDDIAIPFLKTLQKTSPQVDEDSADHIEGAKAGMFFNTVTGELFDGKEKGLLIIPVHRVHQFIEWKPRDEGGGFVAAHAPDSPMVIEAKKGGTFGDLETPDGNELKETFNVFVIIVGEGDREGENDMAIMAFSSTQIKIYKKWMANLRAIIIRDPDGRRRPAPMFAHVFRITTRFQENSKGTWYGLNIGFANGIKAEDSRLGPDSPLFEAAKSFRDVVMSGAAKVDYSHIQEAETSDPDEGSSGGYSESGSDEKVF